MFEIAKVTEKDLPDLAQLYEMLVDRKIDLMKVRKKFTCIDVNDDYYLLGAKHCEANRLIGSLLAIICHDLTGECQQFMILENMIVDKQFRQMGVGKALIRSAERLAMERGCYYIMLVSAGHRKEAHKFYEAHGFGTNAVKGFKKYLLKK